MRFVGKYIQENIHHAIISHPKSLGSRTQYPRVVDATVNEMEADQPTVSVTQKTV